MQHFAHFALHFRSAGGRFGDAEFGMLGGWGQRMGLLLKLPSEHENRHTTAQTKDC